MRFITTKRLIILSTGTLIGMTLLQDGSSCSIFASRANYIQVIIFITSDTGHFLAWALYITVQANRRYIGILYNWNIGRQFEWTEKKKIRPGNCEVGGRGKYICNYL